MMQKEDENLEELLEIFNYNIKREKMKNLDQDTLKYILLKTIRDEWIDILNMMGKGTYLNSHDLTLEIYIFISQEKNKKLGKVQEILFLLE